jgi:hypothetical protein
MMLWFSTDLSLTNMPLRPPVPALFQVTSKEQEITLKFQFQQDLIKAFNKQDIRELAARYADFKGRRLDTVTFQVSKNKSIVVYDHLLYPDLMWDAVEQMEAGSLTVPAFACLI